LDKLPKQQDVLELRKLEEGHDLSPTQVVLFQELELFNNVLAVIEVTLKLLLQGLKGEIGMNVELDELSNSLYNNFLPSKWARRAP